MGYELARKAREVAALTILATGALACSGGEHQAPEAMDATTTTIEPTTTTTPEQGKEAAIDAAISANIERLTPQIEAIRNNEYGFTDPKFLTGELITGTWDLSAVGDTIFISTVESDFTLSTFVKIGNNYVTDTDGGIMTDTSEPSVIVKRFDVNMDKWVEDWRPLNTTDEVNQVFEIVDGALAEIHSRYTSEELALMNAAFREGFPSQPLNGGMPSETTEQLFN